MSFPVTPTVATGKTPSPSDDAIDDSLDGVAPLLLEGVPSGEHEDFKAALIALFKHLGVKTLSDLRFFTGSEVVDIIDTSTKSPLSPPLAKMKLSLLLDFLHADNPFDEGTTWVEIRHFKNNLGNQKNNISSFSGSDGASATVATSTSKYQLEKKTIPKLPKFSGSPSEWYNYSEGVINILGQAGLGRFLDEMAHVSGNVEVAESVFYAVTASLTEGTAHYHAQNLIEQKTLNPFLLWKTLDAYFDTDLNRSNIVLYEIQKMLDLRLDEGSAPDKFISDFQQCLIRLRKGNTSVASDKDFLRALLLVAIQDPAYDTVRDDILKNPNKDAQHFFTLIRQREAALDMKDGPRNLTGDHYRFCSSFAF